MVDTDLHSGLYFQMKTPRKCRTLGLLDLYGLEALGEEVCGFEQLVFNFATEKVQNVINERTLVMEQQEYNLEGVEWTNFQPSTDNHQVVSLLERGSYGVFSILDEVCMTSNNLMMITPASVANSTNEDESGTSTPSLLTLSPDDIFLEKLAERFANHQLVEVKTTNSYSMNTTATASSDTTGGECSTPEVTSQPAPKSTENFKKLPHHCFRYVSCLFIFCKGILSQLFVYIFFGIFESAVCL